MPIGNGRLRRGIEVPNTEFTVASRKSEYLKNPSNPKPTTTDEISEALAAFVPRYFSRSKPWIYPENELPTSSKEYIGSPAK